MSRVLETGELLFLFTPKVDEDSPRGLDDVQRLFAVLRPRDRTIHRRIVIGRKRLPDGRFRERAWAYVDEVATQPEDIDRDLGGFTYQTKTRGERYQPPARAVGQGVYAMIDHDGHTHFAYALELPRTPGPVQKELRIDRRGNFIAVVLNPFAPAPARPMPGSSRTPGFPPELLERFGDRRSLPLAPELLDYPAAELVLIGTAEDVSEIGIHLDPEAESGETTEIFLHLDLELDEQRMKSLLEGSWE
jgi:hypothetical protein